MIQINRNAQGEQLNKNKILKQIVGFYLSHEINEYIHLNNKMLNVNQQ